MTGYRHRSDVKPKVRIYDDTHWRPPQGSRLDLKLLQKVGCSNFILSCVRNLQHVITVSITWTLAFLAKSADQLGVITER
jgi:hypothetical protein